MIKGDFILFIGSSDHESATSRLRTDGVNYVKKLLRSGVDNWRNIVSLVNSPHNRVTLAKLTAIDYATICTTDFENVAIELFDGLANQPHVIFVHENVFLTEEQRQASASPNEARFERPSKPSPFDDPEDDDWDAFYQTRFFGHVTNEDRQKVNSLLRERTLNVMPYRTNAELSVMASNFLDDHEHHLLFRLYVPNSRLYAQEFDSLLELFRQWLSETGHKGIRQQNQSTQAGRIIEFFSDVALPAGGISRPLGEFSAFLDSCTVQPDHAIQQLISQGVLEPAARRLVDAFSKKARRLKLDLKQQREGRILTLKHELESAIVEIEGLEGDYLTDLLEELVPAPTFGSEMIQTKRNLEGALRDSRVLVSNGGARTSSPIIQNQQIINQVAGSVYQNVNGTVQLSSNGLEMLKLIEDYGGKERTTLESAVHELEDTGVRSDDRIVAKSRLSRFLADLGNRGVGVGLEVLQKYVEHAIGLS